MVQKVSATTQSTMAPEAIYELLKDPSTWPLWSPMDSAELVSPGTDEPNGVGSVRALTRGRLRGEDKVLELVPGRRFSYAHLHGLPVRDYRGDVDLEPVPFGTRISWRSTFRPKFVGTGWFWRRAVRRMLRDMTKGLAAYGS